MTETGHLKGRVTKVEGGLISGYPKVTIEIDTSPDPREKKTPAGRIATPGGAWFKPDVPRIGAVCRVIFRSRDAIR